MEKKKIEILKMAEKYKSNVKAKSQRICGIFIAIRKRMKEKRKRKRKEIGQKRD